MDDRHIHCTVHLPGGDHRQARGGKQILAIVVALVGDVRVTMQRQFQQFFEFFVPQFLDRMVDFPVMLR